MDMLIQETDPVGVTRGLSLEDLAEIMPDVASRWGGGGGDNIRLKRGCR